MINGVDVASPYQDSWRPAKGQDFVFVKASQNTGYKNPKRASQLKLARDAGMVVGHYHWMGSGSLSAQLANLKAALDVRAGELIAIDWEESGVTNAEKDSFIKQVKAAYPKNKVGLYCNTNYWLNIDKTGYYGDFLWIAYYSSSQPPISTKWTIWQYSDAGGLDKNRAQFASKAEMKAWAAGDNKDVTPPAPPKGVETAGGVALPAYKTSGTKILWRPLYHNNNVQAKYTCYCVTKAIAVAEARLISLGVIKECLDFWQFGYGAASSASAATHAGGGVVDVVQTDAVTLKVLRQVGFTAAWYRGPGSRYGNFSTPHIHAVLSGCPHPHPSAKDQVTDVRNGRNGLANGARDYGPNVPYITWQDAWKKYVKKSAGTAAKPPKAAEGIVMAKPTMTRRTKDRKLKKSKKWHSLVIDDSSDTKYVMAKGPGTVLVQGTINVDRAALVRFVLMDWKPGKVTTVQAYPYFHIEPGGHPIYFYRNFGGPQKGYEQRHLRVQICPCAGDTTVRDLYLSVGKEA